MTRKSPALPKFASALRWDILEWKLKARGALQALLKYERPLPLKARLLIYLLNHIYLLSCERTGIG